MTTEMLATATPDRSPAETPEERVALLRREVGRFRAGEQRRRFPPHLHLGRVGGVRTTIPVPGRAAALDRAMAFDLLDTALDLPPDTQGEGGVDAWVTRPGVPEVHDLDLFWLTVTDAVVGARGGSLRTFLAITRTGWLDVRTGESRVWKRLRLDR